MNQLPPEILAHIFQLALQDVWEDGSDYYPESDVSSDDSEADFTLSSADCRPDTRTESGSLGSNGGEEEGIDVAPCGSSDEVTDLDADDDDDRFSSESEDADFAEWDRSNLWESPFFTPWILTWVCQYWRATAFSTPLLWSSIHIDFDAHLLYRPLPKIEMLESQLALSNGIPLKIDFSAAAIDQGNQSADIAATLGVLVDHCEQWEDISFCIVETQQITQLLQAIDNRLPCLKRIRIGVGRNYMARDTDILNAIALRPFESAPHLCTLEITSSLYTSWPDSDSLTMFRWSTLTHLSIASNPFNIIRILQFTKDSLETLSLSLTRWDKEPQTSSVTLLQLHKLALHLKPFSAAGERQIPFFAHLKHPNLEVLEWCGPRDEHKVALEMFHQILQHAPSIRAIKWHDNREYESEGFLELLKSAPTVQHVAIMVDFAKHGSSLAASSHALTQVLLALSTVELYVKSKEEDHLKKLLTLAHNCFLAHGGDQSSWPKFSIYIRKPARYAQLIEGPLAQITKSGGHVSVCDWSGIMPDDMTLAQ